MTEVAAGGGAPGPGPSHASRHPPRHTRTEQAALDWSFRTLRALPDLRYLPHLTRHVRALNLSSNALLKLNGLEHLPALESLNVSSNRLVRLDLSQNVNLTTLDASHNSLMAIAGLGGCIRLAHLSLAHNCVSNVEGLDAQRCLETLDLSHNACETLGDISLCARLTHVNVSHNAIASLFGASYKLPNALRVLNLGNNELTDVVEIKHLAACANLVSLVLRGNPLFAFAAACGFEPRAVVAFVMPRLAALDDEGTSTATWSLRARTVLFRNDAGEPCPDLLRLLGEGPARGLHGYLASAVPAAPFASGLWQPNSKHYGNTGATSLDPRGNATAPGPKGGSMYTTSSFVPVDLWSPGPSPSRSPVGSERPTKPSTETSVSDVSVEWANSLDKIQSVARVQKNRDAPRVLETETPEQTKQLTTITNRTEEFLINKNNAAVAAQNSRTRDITAETEMQELRQRVEREAATRAANEKELSALSSASVTELNVAHVASERVGVHVDEEVDTDGDDYNFETDADVEYDDLSAPDLRVLAQAAAQATPPTEPTFGDESLLKDSSPHDAVADTPVSAQRDRLAAARSARAASRSPRDVTTVDVSADVLAETAGDDTRTPHAVRFPSPKQTPPLGGLTPGVPNSPAEFSVSDVSLSPSPIPVTLAARVVDFVGRGGPLSSRTPVAMSNLNPIAFATPIPMSPADGFDFSVSDASREYSAARGEDSSCDYYATREDGHSADLKGEDVVANKRNASSFVSLASGNETDDTQGSFGGLPGAESFLRDAAAQRAWDVVVGLIASSAEDETETEDDRSVSFLRDEKSPAESRDFDRSASGRSTSERTGTHDGINTTGATDDATNASSLNTLPGAEAWLASAEFDRKRGASSRGEISVSGNVSSGSDSAHAGLGRWSGSLARSSGSTGSDRTDTTIDTLPGADDFMKSPGARGAIDAFARAGGRAPFEDDDTTGDDTTGSLSSSGSGSGSVARLQNRTPLANENTRARSVSMSPSPPPPSDRALADALRQKINTLRVVARRNDEARAESGRGKSPLSRETLPQTCDSLGNTGTRVSLITDSVGNTSSGNTGTASGTRSGSSSLDPNTVSRVQSKVELEYETFAATYRAPSLDTGETSDIGYTGTTGETGSSGDRNYGGTTGETGTRGDTKNHVITGDRNYDPNATVDDSDVFHDPLDATGRSSTFASASDSVWANSHETTTETETLASPVVPRNANTAFDADAAVRSTFDTVFGEDFDDGFGDDVGDEVGFSGEDEEDEEEVHDRER